MKRENAKKKTREREMCMKILKRRRPKKWKDSTSPGTVAQVKFFMGRNFK